MALDITTAPSIAASMFQTLANGRPVIDVSEAGSVIVPNVPTKKTMNQAEFIDAFVTAAQDGDPKVQAALSHAVDMQTSYDTLKKGFDAKAAQRKADAEAKAAQDASKAPDSSTTANTVLAAGLGTGGVTGITSGIATGFAVSLAAGIATTVAVILVFLAIVLIVYFVLKNNADAKARSLQTSTDNPDAASEQAQLDAVRRIEEKAVAEALNAEKAANAARRAPSPSPASPVAPASTIGALPPPSNARSSSQPSANR